MNRLLVGVVAAFAFLAVPAAVLYACACIALRPRPACVNPAEHPLVRDREEAS